MDYKEAYEKDLILFAGFLNNKSILSITTNDIKNYIKYLNDTSKKDKTIARKIVSIRTFFDYLMKEKLISINPCEKIETPKIRKTLPKNFGNIL